MWNKPKLRNDAQIKDFYSEAYLVRNLKRWQRSLCARLRSGTLPLVTKVYTKVSQKSSLYVFWVIRGLLRMNLIFLFYCHLYSDLKKNQLICSGCLTLICWVGSFLKMCGH